MYEIPDHLKALYRHWKKHAEFTFTPDVEDKNKVEIDQKVLDQAEIFVAKRMSIWNDKQQGKEIEEQDEILRTYRFCNIYRELDRQTIEIHTKLNSLRKDFDLWLLNLMSMRFICRIQTVDQIGLLDFDKKHNQKVYENLINMSSPKYGTAYIFPISIIQKSQWNTREKFFCFYLPFITKSISEVIQNFQDKTVLSALEEILPAFGFNFRFHWTEILIDIAYQFPEKINLFEDFYIGPGSRPTMKRFSQDIQPEKVCDVTTRKLFGKEKPYLLSYNNQPIFLSAENWEGIGCEFRKYTNLSRGEGRRRKYSPLR